MFSIDTKNILTEEDLQKAANKVLKAFGFSGGVLTYTPIGRLPSLNPGLLKRVIAINLSQDIIDKWFEYQDELVLKSASDLSQTFDPIRRYMSKRVLPRWINVKNATVDRKIAKNAVSVKYLKGLMEIGIRESIHIPIFTGRGEYWSFIALRYDDNPITGPLSEEKLANLYWISAEFVSICINKLDWRKNLPDDLKKPLTPRELECLYWTAQGMTSIETADILGIQTETARKYLKLAIFKLKARNNTHAVHIAYKLGYFAS